MLVAVNAKYIHSNPAIYSLKAYAGPYGKYVDLAEYTINHEMDDVLKDIYVRRPDIIGFSCYIWNITFIGNLLYDIQRVLPNTKIWLGGPEVSFDPEKVMTKFPMVTGVMMGEGEQVFLNLLKHYTEKELDLCDIRGLAYRNQEGIIRINAPQPVMDLTDVPFLYSNLEPFENKIIYYESSRGCPFRCSYCLSSVDKSVRFRDLEVVKSELAFFLDNKVAQVKFVDRTFNCNRNHGLEIWKYIQEHDNGITNFHFEVSADLIQEEELEVLKGMRPGLVQLEIGVQTTNPVTAKEIRRNAKLKEIKRVVKRINEFENIHQHLDLIAGLPFEDYKSFKNSFNEVYALKPEQLQLGFLKVLKGSYMYDMVKEYGIAYKNRPPYEVLYTKWISYEDILRLKSVEEMLEVYYNSGQFKNTIAYLERGYETPFELYESLARYYEKNELFHVKHTRVARYLHLRDFTRQTFPDKMDVIDATLLLDLYLRENVKKRPDFAPDLKLYKEQIQDFYKKEAEEHKYLRGYESFTSKQLMNMTHIEVFSINMEHLYKTGEVKTEEYMLLFDYKHRNPLTYDGITYTL